jgi:hypothetical protein
MYPKDSLLLGIKFNGEDVKERYISYGIKDDEECYESLR